MSCDAHARASKNICLIFECLKKKARTEIELFGKHPIAGPAAHRPRCRLLSSAMRLLSANMLVCIVKGCAKFSFSRLTNPARLLVMIEKTAAAAAPTQFTIDPSRKRLILSFSATPVQLLIAALLTRYCLPAVSTRFLCKSLPLAWSRRRVTRMQILFSTCCRE